VVALEALSEICQEFGDELVNSQAETFPRVDPSMTAWMQPGGNALVRDHDERAENSSAAMSAMFVVLKMFCSYRDSYVSCMLELQQAQATQRQLCGRVHRHQRAAREAQRETNNAIIALEAHRVQLVNAIAKRDVARAEL